MEKKKKKIWIIGGLVLCLVAVIGITFAFFSTGGTQDTANTFTSGCLNIELTDASSSIKLTNAYPISDVEGVDSTSYDFTVRNTCDTPTNYSINLESLNQVSNTLNADYIKVSLSSDTFDNVISKLSTNTKATPELDVAYEAYTLYTANLGAHEEKTYHLKLWIDYNATVEQAANKTYSSKINVIANPETEVVDSLEATFTLDDKTLTSSLSNNVTSATYCTTTTNICEPTTTASITNNSYTVELEENNSNQMVCTKLNGTSKVICSNGLEVKPLLGGEYILAQEGGAEAIEAKGTPDFSKTAQANCDGIENCEETNGMYAAEDDYGTTYYYRGAVNNNWFQFGTNSSGQPLYWRIVRINGDGSIRLIYNGTSTATTGNSTMINTGLAFNTSYNNNMYVGYMYESGEVHGLVESSDIKKELDEWYFDNLTGEGEADKIDGNAGFCGDRTSTTSSSGAPNNTGGTGTTTTYYGARYRLNTNKTPSFKCTYEDASKVKQDLYTTNGSSKGNGKLTYPIGLITADEVAFAGGVYGSSNTSYYLYNNAYYWTMSPYYFDGSLASVFRVNSSGSLSSDIVGWADYGVRPVINLKSAIAITGSGTTGDPFKVG